MLNVLANKYHFCRIKGGLDRGSGAVLYNMRADRSTRVYPSRNWYLYTGSLFAVGIASDTQTRVRQQKKINSVNSLGFGELGKKALVAGTWEKVPGTRYLVGFITDHTRTVCAK